MRTLIDVMEVRRETQQKIKSDTIRQGLKVERFACDNPNADERNLLFSLISFKFVPCEVQRLTLA